MMLPKWDDRRIFCESFAYSCRKRAWIACSVASWSTERPGTEKIVSLLHAWMDNIWFVKKLSRSSESWDWEMEQNWDHTRTSGHEQGCCGCISYGYMKNTGGHERLIWRVIYSIGTWGVLLKNIFPLPLPHCCDDLSATACFPTPSQGGGDQEASV